MKIGAPGKIIRLIVIAALVAGLGGLATQAQTPQRIGEFEWVSLGTAHPYLRDLGDSPREWTIRWPQATYIRVHFSRFDLAPGDFVEISDLSGTRVHRYEGRGPHGTGEFWAFTTPGDAAIVRLEASFGDGYGFDIDGYGRGTVDIFNLREQSESGYGVVDPGFGFDPGGAQTDSVCGTNDWDNVECYNSTYPTEREKARGAVKAIIGCCSSCTAFKASDSGQFMTNNHCTSSSSGVQSTELLMEYKLSGCSNGSAVDSGSVMGDRLLSTDYDLDYTLMSSAGNSSGIPCLAIENRLPPAGERIYIAGHPSGGVKKLSVESSYPGNGGQCQVDGSPVAGRTANSDIGYYCDTTNGSSGSPVLSGDSHKVVAIHHYGGCMNSGVRMDLILDQIAGQLDTCTDGGGGPTCASQGSSCTSHSDCCSNKCRGGKNKKTCR